MLQRARLAMRRLLTMANLFENLYELYGDREALCLAAPAGYRLFPSASFGYGDCLRFTILAAEAFIDGLDLKKGERVVLCITEPAELLLVSAALVKAGGIAVPLEHTLSAGEMAQRVSGCGATLAVVDGRVIEERPDLRDAMRGVERMMVAGGRSQVPEGMPSLDEAMDSSSGFFLPYTLKPSNVVGLFHTRMSGGAVKAVMATNQGMLGLQLRSMPLFPTRPGDLGICATSLLSAAGFSAALLGLCMGLRLRLLPPQEAERTMEVLGEERPVAFLGTPETFTSLQRAGAPGREGSTVRLWFSAGGPLPQETINVLRTPSAPYAGKAGRRALFIEAYDAGGNATMLALKPAQFVAPWLEPCPGLVVPPNRASVVDPRGQHLRGGEEGELVIRGPAVTPGYWNDVEGTLEAKRDGWLHTGIRASRQHLLITLR